MTPQEAFVTRLRRHRQRNRISLEEIAADTRVKRELLEALEQNNLAEWPRGLYARAWIRAYASAVGLDPIDTVDEFCRLFPMGNRRGQDTIEDIASIVASTSQYRDDFDPAGDRRSERVLDSAATRSAWHTFVMDAARASARQASDLVADVTRTLTRNIKARSVTPRQH